MIVQSASSTENSSVHEAIYEMDHEGMSKNINDERIIDEEIASLRAKAEFLTYGEKQNVEFTTHFVELHINDIITLSAPDYRIPKELEKNRFIVKNVKHTFEGAKATTYVKAVRYD